MFAILNANSVFAAITPLETWVKVALIVFVDVKVQVTVVIKVTPVQIRGDGSVNSSGNLNVIESVDKIGIPVLT